MKPTVLLIILDGLKKEFRY